MRARNIKPSTFANEILGEADPLLTILFAGLWCMADKEGRLEDRPLKIKGEILRYREGIDINGYLTELQRLEFIRRYSVAGKNYIQVVNFTKHQNPHHTEKASEIPEEIIKLNDPIETDVKQPLNTGDTPADSRFLIPDPLIPEDMSGKEPDPAPPVPEKPKNAELKAQATEVLQFLNSKSGRNYQPVNGTLDSLVARLREGFTVTQCRQVIAKKCRDWQNDEKMEPYLRPKTLFNRTNFANYVGELEVIHEQEHN